MVFLKVKQLRPNVNIQKVESTEFSTGVDVRFNPSHNQDITIYPGETVMLETGIAVEYPPGKFDLQYRSRSGLSSKGLISLAGVGTVDADYRGELKSPVMNIGKGPINIRVGDRIGQLVMGLREQMEIIEVDHLNETLRDNRGFGSTGK